MKRNNQDNGIKLILSIIYPLGGFFYSWKNLKSNSSYWAIFLFLVCYGFCLNAVYEPEDSFRYAQELHTFSMNAKSNWNMVVKDFFSSESTTKDIFVYALYYISSTFFGGSPRVFFGLVAIVFGYFFLHSFRYITFDSDYNNSVFYILLAVIFLLSNPFYNISSVRFWTAAWIAVYAMFQILLSGNKRYLLLLLCLPFVHGSYYVFWLFFIIGFFARHFYKALPYVFFISFFITDVALQIIPDITDYLPPFLQNMVWAYTESETALSRMSDEEAESTALYARILMALPKYFHIIMIFMLVRSQKFFKDNKSREFLGFLLAYGSLVNFSSIIPSMLRFWHLIIPLYIYIWVHNGKVMFRYKSFVYLYPIIALYPTFRVLRYLFWTTDPILYFSNTIHIILKAFL